MGSQHLTAPHWLQLKRESHRVPDSNRVTQYRGSRVGPFRNGGSDVWGVMFTSKHHNTFRWSPVTAADVTVVLGEISRK
eukprot:342708-Rhodomonas_salina.2